MDHLTDKAFYIVLKKEKKEKKTIIRFLRNVYEEKKNNWINNDFNQFLFRGLIHKHFDSIEQ